MRRRFTLLLMPLLVMVAGYWGIRLVSATPLRRRLRRTVLSRVTTRLPHVALTFDDGPDPEFTDRFLDALGKVPATFFVLGERVRRWPHLVRRVVEAGHEVASHGDSHMSGTRLLPRATVNDLRKARATILAVAGAPPRFYRPPFGRFNLASWVEARRLGMTRTLWTAGARDWESKHSAETIATRLLAHAEPGAILMLHDSDGEPGAPENTLLALPLILQGLRERGLVPVTLSELIDGGLGERPER